MPRAASRRMARPVTTHRRPSPPPHPTGKPPAKPRRWWGILGEVALGVAFWGGYLWLVLAFLGYV